MAATIFSSQYRTVNETYCFQCKDEKTVVLKIYDLSKKLLFKTALEFEASKTETFFKNPTQLLTVFEQKGLTSLSSFKDLTEELEGMIKLLRIQTPVEIQEKASFLCPITYEIFKDPVIDNCGHTFEKEIILKILENKNQCPFSNLPITTLVPNLQLRQVIDEAKPQDPIPTFRQFKKTNNLLASNQIQMAQAYVQEKEYEEALDAYTKAFQYTQKWEDYQPIPILFQEMGIPQKAHLASLYLAKYQIEAQEYDQALQTLETLLKQQNPNIGLPLCLLLVHLYGAQKRLPNGSTLAFSIAHYISHLPKEEQRTFVKTYRYQLQFHLIIQMLANCLWENSNQDIKTLEQFFEWLYNGNPDLVGSYQTGLVLSCLDACGSPELEKQIWQKYKIENFLNCLLEESDTRNYLSRLMELFECVFTHIVRKLQNEGSDEHVNWVLRDISRSIKKEYLTDDFWIFMKNALHVRQWTGEAAADVIGGIAPLIDKKKLPTIITWLEKNSIYKNGFVQMAANDALKKIACLENKEELPPTDLVDENSSPVSTNFIEKMIDLANKEAFPELLNEFQIALFDKDSLVRDTAIHSIKKVASVTNNKIIPELLSLLYDALDKKESDKRFKAVNAFAEVEILVDTTTHTQPLKWLQEALIDKERYVREVAGRALGKIAIPKNKQKLPQLLDCLQIGLADQENNGALFPAIASIEKIVKVTKAAASRELTNQLIDLLLKALIHTNPCVNQSAAGALGEMTNFVDKETQTQLLSHLQTTLLTHNSSRIWAASMFNKCNPHFLASIFIAKDQPSFITNRIFQCFVYRSIPLCFITTRKRHYFIQAGNTDCIKININQKKLAFARIQEGRERLGLQ